MSAKGLLFSGILPETELSSFLETDFEVRPRHFRNCPFVGFGFETADFLRMLRDTNWEDGDHIAFYENNKNEKFHDLNKAGIDYSGVLTLDMLMMMKARKISIYVKGLEKRDQSLRLMHHSVASSGAVGSHINAFFSPASAQAANDHWDNHDLMALQVSGRKEWNVVGAPEIEAVIHAGTLYPPKDYKLEGAQKYLLEPGDALYIPRGCGHNAIALDEDSLHLVFGIKPLQWHEVLDDWLAKHVPADATLRRTVFGSYASGTPEIDPDRLADIFARLTPETLAKHISEMAGLRARRATLTDLGQTFAKDLDALIQR